jgi:RNA polymerase sigma-70 factor (ECF subfamily)
VARLIGRYVRSPHDIEELTQETFLKAFRGLPSFRGDSAFSTWLQRIAGYTAQNFLDYARLRPSVDADENAEATNPSVDTEDPEGVMMSKQIAETVSRTIALLPEIEREALLMRELEGLRYDEIARRAGCPIGTIRTRIFRARERVAQALLPLLEPTRGKRW